MNAGCFVHLISVKLNIFVKENYNSSAVFFQRGDECKRISFGVINNGNRIFYAILKRDQVFIRNCVVGILPLLRFGYYHQRVHVLNLSIMLQCGLYLLPTRHIGSTSNAVHGIVIGYSVVFFPFLLPSYCDRIDRS